MDLQHANGSNVKNATAKENNNNAAQNAAAKPNAIAKTEQPKTDAKPDIKLVTQPVAQPLQQQPIKPVYNLEGTLKKVDELHRRSIQRLNLISRIKQLESFEVNLAQENDELEDNPYQGCKLIIEDDKRRQFITTTPGLIRLVSQFIFESCHEKLAEIEAEIVFPNV